MFQIKKDNYNSVQLLPDYSSSSVRSNASFRRGRHTTWMIAILVIVLLAALLLAGGYIYFTHFSPVNAYEKALAEQDYSTCRELSEENSFDTAFVEGIRTSLLAEADGILSSYKEGSLKSDEAVAQLQNLDDISDGAFQESIDGMINQIQVSEQVYDAFRDAEATLLSQKYLEGLKKLMTTASAAAEHGVDLESEISTAMTDNQYGIKAALFREFSTMIRRAEYKQITSYIDFVSPYIGDSDFSDFRTAVAGVQAGTETARNASRTASTVAANADTAAQTQRRSAEPQTGTQE